MLRWRVVVGPSNHVSLLLGAGDPELFAVVCAW